MAEEVDYYRILGLSRGASTDEIRKAYRQLARKHHPDLHPNDPVSLERFKEMTAANEVLSDPKKRKLYDEFGHIGLREGFNAQQARAYGRPSGRPSGGMGGGGMPGFDGFGDLFGDLFSGGQGARAPRRGQDVSGHVDVSLPDAARGTQKSLRVPQNIVCPTCQGAPHKRMRCPSCQGQGQVQSMQDVSVRIPPGVAQGTRLRVAGRGSPGPAGNGDLLLEVRIKPHPFFRQEGRDLVLRLPLSISEALCGAQVSVPTPTGSVTLRVPAGTQGGTRMRLRGKGPQHKAGPGDLFVEIELRLPDAADDGMRDAAKQLDAGYSKPLREALTL